MDRFPCNVIYVDRNAPEGRKISGLEALAGWTPETDSTSVSGTGKEDEGLSSFRHCLKGLLGVFSEVTVCRTGKDCISKLSELSTCNTVEPVPTLVLIDVPSDDVLESTSTTDTEPAPDDHGKTCVSHDGTSELYGYNLLQSIVTGLKTQHPSNPVVPIVVNDIHKDHAIDAMDYPRLLPNTFYTNPFDKTPKPGAGVTLPQEHQRAFRFISAGAVDVLTKPINPEQLLGVALHVYRVSKNTVEGNVVAHQPSRERKRSWVGVDDTKPYSYLREEMVSGLMDAICGFSEEIKLPIAIPLYVEESRKQAIMDSVGNWNFSAHDYSDDELLHCGLVMLEHALELPELEEWRLTTEQLRTFLAACRAAYNSFVPYHNFRHVIDVLQAVFYFLIQLGTLPPYPLGKPLRRPSQTLPKPPIPALLGPFEALTLLIAAIGHDVGHPGVNNAFLVTLNAPLAQLYNDRSVLESFHCAAYCQILRRHWPAAFDKMEMRQMMISTILATDMGVHFDYMKKLGWLQEKLHENRGAVGWNGRVLLEYRTLACCLLIKCADICNVARSFECAAKWCSILSDEFSRQATMESDLGIPTALFAAPVREIVALGKSQIGFINIFALPLFQGVADVMPAMMFSVEQLLDNRANWEAKIKVEQRRLKGGGQVDRKDSDDSIAREGTFSPRNVSVTNSKTDSRQHRPPTASSQSEPVKKRPSVQEEVMKLAQGPRNNSTASEFDNPPPEPENEAQPYRSHTIPVGDPKMEALEQLAIVPTNTVLGQMQRVYNSVSTGLLEYPRPISSTSHDRATLQPATATSRLAERDVEPVTVITSSKICDGIEIPSDPSTMPLSNDWASSGTDGTNGTTATNGTASRAAGSTRGTSVESSDEPKRSPRKTARIPSASAPDFPSAHDKTSSVVADAHAVSAFSEAEPRAPGQGILASMRSVTRKPSKGRFRFWRKKSDKHALDGIPPVPPISVPSTPQSATP